MEYCNDMKITMKNKKMATEALALIKDTIQNTTIQEERNGQFTEFADNLAVKKNTIIIDGYVSVDFECFNELMTEICNILAAHFSDCNFEGYALYLATYDTGIIEFTYSDKDLKITSELKDIDDDLEDEEE